MSKFVKFMTLEGKEITIVGCSRRMERSFRELDKKNRGKIRRYNERLRLLRGVRRLIKQRVTR